MLSEESKMAILNTEDNSAIKAITSVPYALLSEEVSNPSAFFAELAKIYGYYKVYKEGAVFYPEGSNSDYAPADLKYKLAASLIKKEARFLFAEAPSITVKSKGDAGAETEEMKNALMDINDLVSNILDDNKFEDSLLKAAKDCFIGKRVAGLVNFNEEEGVTVTFLPSTNFVYEMKNNGSKVVSKFVAFMLIEDNKNTNNKRFFKKKYELGEDGAVYLEESIYDGAGNIVEERVKKQQILLKEIPVVIFVNDGLTGEYDGESELEDLKPFEEWYSKMSNADMDAERKSMNPIRYTIDMASESTQNLSSAAGSHWDLGSDQNLENARPAVGILESNMNYSYALKVSLDRVKTTAYEQVDMPNITLESMQGVITSGKALKSVYWSLIVRCKEKMKMWGPQLRKLIDIIIKGSVAYSNCITKYTDNEIMQIPYKIVVEQNTPLPEDEIEEKNMDLMEVEAQVMSKKSYMKKWRNLSDDEAQAELEQIALERQIVEDSFAESSSTIKYNYVL